MSEDFQDRLISASEVERWCYCPLSWKLERKGSHEDSPILEKGIAQHEKLGKEANGIIQAQIKVRQNTITTWAFLAFSIVLLLMGISLVVVTQVGSLDVKIWRIGVIVLSIILISISIAYYFRYRDPRSSQTKGALRKIAQDFDSRDMKRSNTPILFYMYGILLMVNGVVLLRPFGIDYENVRTFLAFSLIVMYLFMLVSVTLYFRSRRSKLRGKNLNLGAPLVIMLLISLSVLFIFISDQIDPRGDFGWVFLIISLIWFIGAIGHDLSKMIRSGRKRTEQDEIRDLPIASMALLASVFTASTFLAKEENLDFYSRASAIIAVMWLIGAVFFFWRGSHHLRVVEKGKEELSLPKGSVMISVDDIENKKGTKPLTSKKHFLIGAPDMIIDEGDNKIPVEVKTGRVPMKPHFSHIMQLSAYLVLMDVNYHQDTPYGYLEYVPSKSEKKRFKIEWDLITKALVLSKVSEIREAERTDVAHRNHNREGKCKGCSRRHGCPERLA
jgi:CRISPR-associated exonuclease Cas4